MWDAIWVLTSKAPVVDVTNDFCEFLYRYSTGRVPVPSAWLGTGRFKQRGTWGNSLLTISCTSFGFGLIRSDRINSNDGFVWIRLDTLGFVLIRSTTPLPFGILLFTPSPMFEFILNRILFQGGYGRHERGFFQSFFVHWLIITII